ncbi:hypothetical protein PENTCL1PPCAC_5607, partial [Pristionchus entomophagus]
MITLISIRLRFLARKIFRQTLILCLSLLPLLFPSTNSVFKIDHLLAQPYLNSPLLAYSTSSPFIYRPNGVNGTAVPQPDLSRQSNPNSTPRAYTTPSPLSHSPYDHNGAAEPQFGLLGQPYLNSTSHAYYTSSPLSHSSYGYNGTAAPQLGFSGQPHPNSILDDSMFYERKWNPTTAAGHFNTNNNSYSPFTGFDWMNQGDLSASNEELAPDIQNYNKPSSQNVDRDENRPKVSYAIMVALAFENSASGHLRVAEIYTFICEHFPYFRTAPDGWKNSLRHAISHNEFFYKSDPKSNGRRSGLWSIRPEKQTEVNFKFVYC